MRFLVLNGPNINLLGTRQPQMYGSATYSDLVALAQKAGEEQGVEVECRQSNHEGDLVDAIQGAKGKFDGIVINPAAYTHTSIAILDALLAVELPAAEVHISDVTRREDFRQISYAGKACQVHVIGQGIEGYKKAIIQLKKLIETEK